MSDFHSKHFSSASIDHFSACFLGPVEEIEVYAEEEEEGDSLGYYDDGVKRTLTDEQIAMFRHSEIETLLREKRRSDEAKSDMVWDMEREAVEDLGPNTKASETPPTPLKEVQERHTKPSMEDQKKKKSHFKRNIKPDLRKRTWDKVDSGLETLDYEDDVAGPSAKRTTGPQRRTVSYDDM